MKNKLDPFGERLDEWRASGKTLAQMQAALKDDGCAAALSSISEFLSRRSEERMQKELFASIATGGRMNRELDAAYQENPDPDVAQLIRVTKTLTMSLQVRGVADPKLLGLANSMLQTVLNYLSGKTKAELEGRKLALSLEKFELECCTKFLAWFRDAKAREIAESNATNADKIARLRQTYFADVDELEKSGAVKLPE